MVDQLGGPALGRFRTQITVIVGLSRFRRRQGVYALLSPGIQAKIQGDARLHQPLTKVDIFESPVPKLGIKASHRFKIHAADGKIAAPEIAIRA